MDNLSLELKLRAIGYIPFGYECKLGTASMILHLDRLEDFIGSQGNGMNMYGFVVSSIMRENEWVITSGISPNGEKRYFYRTGPQAQVTDNPLYAFPKRMYEDAKLKDKFLQFKMETFLILIQNGFTNIKEEVLTNLELFDLWFKDYTIITEK